MLRPYSLFQVDGDGRQLSSATFLLLSDQAALAKAGEHYLEGNVEIWQGQRRVALLIDESRGAEEMLKALSTDALKISQPGVNKGT